MLTKNGWQSTSKNIPKYLFGHCMLLDDLGTVWVIGGCNDDTCYYADDVFYFDSTNMNWLNSQTLLNKRSHHTCSMILKNTQSQILTKIVVGGSNELGSTLDSVEIFDDQSNSWIYGPKLPMPITNAAMVNDAKFGIILIGGTSQSTIHETFYYLGDSSSQWVMMPIKLKIARLNPTAFLIPDNITNCT